MTAIFVAMGKRPLLAENVVNIEMNGNIEVLTKNVVSSIVGVQMKDYISLLTLAILKSNVIEAHSSPVQQKNCN